MLTVTRATASTLATASTQTADSRCNCRDARAVDDAANILETGIARLVAGTFNCIIEVPCYLETERNSGTILGGNTGRGQDVHRGECLVH